MRRSVVAMVIGSLVLAGSCSSGSSGSDDAGGEGSGRDGRSAATAPGTTAGGPGAGEEPTTGLRTDCDWPAAGARTVEAAGEQRTYELHLPDAVADGRRAPLLVLFHGHAGNATQIAELTALDEVATAAGIVVAAPQGLGDPPTWGVLAGLERDEPFVNAVLDELTALPCVDPDRVWLSGHSAGAAFSAVFGCRNAERIEGLGLNAGLAPPLCEPGTTPQVIITHGDDDDIVPYGGGEQPVGDVLIPLDPVPVSAAGWAERAACDPEPVVTTPVDGVEVRQWSGCDRGDVRLQTIAGGGHTWAGAPDLPRPRQQGPTDFDASCVLVALIADPHGDPYPGCRGARG